MRILVLQHHEAEGPGIFRQFLAEDGHELVAADPGADRPLPALDGFDALWVMGGVMNTWEEDTYPWLTDEKALIREALDLLDARHWAPLFFKAAAGKPPRGGDGSGSPRKRPAGSAAGRRRRTPSGRSRKKRDPDRRASRR